MLVPRLLMMDPCLERTGSDLVELVLATLARRLMSD